MTDVTVASHGSAAPPPALAEKTPPSAIPQTEWSPSDAARLLASRRVQKQAEPPPDVDPPAEPPQELAEEANAAPQAIEATGETQETDPAEAPPLDLPRSWTKEQADTWKALPRSVQEYLTEQDSKTSAATRKAQNEAAEQRKAYEAQREQVEKARQEYEAKLPALMQALHDASPFADVKTMADVERLQAEDPFRFQQFQVYQWKMQGVQTELQAAEQRKASEKQTKWTDHVQKESVKFDESLSDADKAKLSQLRADAPKYLEERGFSQEELTKLANGEDRLSIYDHRIQSLILDGMKYRDAQKAKAAAVAKPVPPVVKPGAPKSAANSNASKIQALEKQLQTAPGHAQAKLMAEIRMLRKASR